jgi:glycosyltransferase involved in cell wall biosynthesis
MRIAMISKADRFGGGASRIAEELCVLLESHGHTAHHYVARTDHPQSFTRYVYGTRRIGKLLRGLHYATQRIGFQDLIPWEFLVLRLFHRIDRYDIVHFHDLSTAISPFTVQLVSRRVPTVWTFHDCAGFTGGCIFPVDCRKFENDCGACPQLSKWPLSFSRDIDFTSVMLRIKRKILADNSIHVIAPSQWMAATAKASGARLGSLTVIPYGIDTALYWPLDKHAVRQSLGLPTDKNIILLSAGDILDHRKGFIYSLRVLQRVRHELNPFILVVGKTDEEMRRQFFGFEYLETGFLADDRMKAQYFAAADVLLFCPLDDNLPLTVMETMATATPMVGFATGGIPEMFENEVSGYLVGKGDVDGVATGLKLAFKGGRAVEWGRAARKRVESVYRQEMFLDNHLNLFQEAISSFGERAR